MARHTRVLQWLMVLAGCLVLAACGTGRTLVKEAPTEKKAFQSAKATRSPDTVTVPEEYRKLFANKIRERLYGTKQKPGPFTEGDGLTIEIKVVQFDEGSQALRYLTGGIGNSGEGSLQVQAHFLDNGKKLAEILIEGRIGSGLFGGSMGEAVDKAAEQIAKYAIDNFR